MPIRHAIWTVSPDPVLLSESELPSEQLLESMIVKDIRILSEDWMLIGRQEDTGSGGRIDLLAIAPDGTLVLIELKRGRTPREVVAQALDYACWVETLNADAISKIYQVFNPSGNFHSDFERKFQRVLDEESLNQNHQIIVVAATLDPSTERIIKYLSERRIAINVLFFQVFTYGTEQLLSRSWLIDPTQTQIISADSAKDQDEPWNGEYYCSFGDHASRSWADAVEFGFISAGGGEWFTRTLNQLKPGDRVWVKDPEVGYLGVGRVTGLKQAASSFVVQTPQGEKPILEVANRANYHRHQVNDLTSCEYFVPIRWLDTVTSENAVGKTGTFGNQNTICKPLKPKWRQTIALLKERFPNFDGP